MNSGKSLFWLLRRKIVYPILCGLLLILSIALFHSIVNNRKIQERLQTDLNNELRSFVELQYFALHQIEIPLDAQLQSFCEKLQNGVFAQTANIENADLKKVMIDAGIDTVKCNLYIINRNGVVVNATSLSELFSDFTTFGPLHISYLNERFEKMDFGAPSFFFDSGKSRYVKYAYMPTLDGKYVIEIGAYSSLADAVFSYASVFLNRKTDQYANVVDINQYALTTKPKSFDITKKFPQEHIGCIPELQENGQVTLTGEVDGEPLNYTYLYVDCITSNQIYKGIIIGITTKQDSLLFPFDTYSLIYLLLFLTILILTFLYVRQSSGKMEESIRSFVDKVQSMSEGTGRKTIEENDGMFAAVAELSRLVVCCNKLSALADSRDSQMVKQASDIYSAKRKIIELQEMVRQQKQLADEKMSGIGDGLEYACNIQKAMLPGADDLHEIFSESFLFLKPMSAVSGDYYWFSKVGNKAVVVVADCSGHGIEASFVSVLNMSILNNIVNNCHLDDPVQILSRLHLEQKMFHRGRLGKQFSYYGIDISVCCVDLDNLTLSFASACGRIVVVSNGILQTYKGNDVSLGKNIDESHCVFTDKTIKLNHGDAVYMFTNGYSVQFDSCENRKFGYDAFCNLIKQISSKPMEEQLSLLNDNLLEWKGEAEQTDDILVLGFKC